jgi:NAD(P)H-flavin reductase
MLGVRGAFGRGWGVADGVGGDVVVVAGGIGLAPLRPAIYAVLAHRGSYQRVSVLSGARTSLDVLFVTLALTHPTPHVPLMTERPAAAHA